MKRDEHITIQEKVTTYDDDTNEPVEKWDDVATVWAKATPRTGNEDFQQVQEQAFQRYQFKILHRDGLDISMRIQWDNKNWNIRSITRVQNEIRRKELEIIAEWKQGTEG